MMVPGHRPAAGDGSHLRRVGLARLRAGGLGLPTSAEFQEPQWVKQNFQHGTLNFDRLSGRVSRVIDGVVEEMPPPPATGPPVQLERRSYGLAER